MNRGSDGARLQDVEEFYAILDELEHVLGGKRTLAEAHGRMSWPTRGVYFFFEIGESRTTSGSGPRVTRIGTHALKRGQSLHFEGSIPHHLRNPSTHKADLIVVLYTP